MAARDWAGGDGPEARHVVGGCQAGFFPAGLFEVQSGVGGTKVSASKLVSL